MGPFRQNAVVVSCARSVTHRRMRSLTCSSSPRPRPPGPRTGPPCPKAPLADRADHLELDQAIQLAAIFDRKFLVERLDEAVHRHRLPFSLGDASSLPAAE